MSYSLQACLVVGVASSSRWKLLAHVAVETVAFQWGVVQCGSKVEPCQSQPPAGSSTLVTALVMWSPAFRSRPIEGLTSRAPTSPSADEAQQLSALDQGYLGHLSRRERIEEAEDEDASAQAVSRSWV